MLAAWNTFYMPTKASLIWDAAFSTWSITKLANWPEVIRPKLHVVRDLPANQRSAGPILDRRQAHIGKAILPALLVYQLLLLLPPILLMLHCKQLCLLMSSMHFTVSRTFQLKAESNFAPGIWNTQDWQRQLVRKEKPQVQSRETEDTNMLA